MTAAAFQGLRPASRTGHVQWAVRAMAGKEGVALVVPHGFDACVRLLHPLEGHQRWAATAPAYVVSGVDPYPYPFPQIVMNVEGDMGPGVVDALIPVLTAATTVPQECHFALWTGWGELHPGSSAVLYARPSSPGPFAALRSRRAIRRGERARRRSMAPVFAFVEACAVQPWWGGRDMLLFDGPIGAVASIGCPLPFADSIRRRGPQWWWPADRAWFVATEIDVPWTYVVGASELIESLIAHSMLETVRIDHASLW